MRVKKLIKVGLSEGGAVQLDFPFGGGGGGAGGGGVLIMNPVTKKVLC